ncbi:hypothetical protein HaLaN_07389 [Haematococcus lacustris]|uniref:Uncharacterized protein n=1 Tax=Haematococcus lacustris TaxID=44745 RepID=A0A699YNW9_HAELA|nr:hypothetical protein HaLaN_07389 [Haematococcus lacustris]
MEVKAPLAHPCRPAVLICAAVGGCDVTIGASEADLQVPVLTGSTGTTSGMVSVLQAGGRVAWLQLAQLSVAKLFAGCHCSRSRISTLP